MARRPRHRINKGDVLMHLSITGCHRARAARSAGVSGRTFQRWMRAASVRAPRSDAKLDSRLVATVRKNQGQQTRAALSALCGVSKRTIDQVLSNDTWRDISGE